jgi:hypothetical protein
VDRVSVSERVAAPVSRVFAIVSDPARHVDIDGSGMLQAAPDAMPLTAVGQTFEMDMDRCTPPCSGYRRAGVDGECLVTSYCGAVHRHPVDPEPGSAHCVSKPFLTTSSSVEPVRPSCSNSPPHGTPASSAGPSAILVSKPSKPESSSRHSGSSTR